MNGYLILDLTINDFSIFKEYIEKIPEFIKKHGGRYVVKGMEPEVMEGDWSPERVVVLEFPSTELYQRIRKDDVGLVATDMRDVQEMTNVLISYRNDLWPRPDLEFPKLMTLAEELIELIEAEYPEE